VAKQLLAVQVFGGARLDVAVRNSDLRDSIGSAIDVASSESSSLALTVADTTLQHFGHGIINGSATQSSHLAIAIHGSQFAAPAVRERAWIEVAGKDKATVCADVTANRFTAPEGTAIHLAAAAGSQLAIAGAASDSKAAAAAVTAANGGASVVIDGVIAANLTCP
jgi:hypothetical protein